MREFLNLSNVKLISLPERSTNSLHWMDFVDCLRAVKPQVVHLHFTGVVNLLPWSAYCSGVRKIFYTDHGSSAAGLFVRPPVYKRCLARALTMPLTAQIAVSQFVRKRGEAVGYISQEKMIQIYNGVDLGRVGSEEGGASFRTRLGIPSDRIVVLQVSNLIPEKGCDLMISALAAALPRNPFLHGVLVGGGPQKFQLMKLAQQGGVSDRMTFLPLSVDPFGEGVFSAADIVCCPSVWDEAFGFALVEAMAHGKPAIASAVGAIPEILDCSVANMLIERNDVEGLTERILQLASDPRLRDQIGWAAKRVVRQRFDLTERISELLRVYGIIASPTRTKGETAEPEVLHTSR